MKSCDFNFLTNIRKFVIYFQKTLILACRDFEVEMILLVLISFTTLAECSIYCSSTMQCPDGYHCVLSSGGIPLCEKNSPRLAGENTLIGMKFKYCMNDRDCQGIGSKCIIYGWYGVCEISPASIGSGAHDSRTHKGKDLNEPCVRDGDCKANMQCVDLKGKNLCQITVGTLTPKDCENSDECLSDEICIFSDELEKTVCQNKSRSGVIAGGSINSIDDGAFVVGSEAGLIPRAVNRSIGSGLYRLYEGIGTGAQPLNEEIGKGAVPATNPWNGWIGDGASPINSPRRDGSAVTGQTGSSLPAGMPCTNDYQCRAGESCSGLVMHAGQKVLVCVLNIGNRNRLCYYSSDCLTGQRCLRNATGAFVCQTSYEASVHQARCIFDFECSAGERCINVGSAGNKDFRCRPVQNGDSRVIPMNCMTSADCPARQVCAFVGRKPQCVDISLYGSGFA